MPSSQLCCTMGNFKSCHGAFILMLLLQIRSFNVEAVEHMPQKLRRLKDQFQQFQALTEARFDMLALIRNLNSSRVLESHVHAPTDHWYHVSKDFEHLKQRTRQEIQGLRDWSRRLEKRSKRMEGRLALMEHNVREKSHYSLKQKHNPGQDFFNLTLQLQNQEGRLDTLQTQHDELLVRLKGLQESLTNQEMRVTQLEIQLSRKVDLNGREGDRELCQVAEPLDPDVTQLEYTEPPKRGRTPKGRKTGHTQSRLGGQRGHLQTNSQTTAQSRYPKQQHSKIPETRPEGTTQQEQIRSSHHHGPYVQTQPQVHQQSQPLLYPPSQQQIHNHSLPSWSKPLSRAQTHLKPSDQTKVDGLEGGEGIESDSKSSVINRLLQLPERQKIPARPVPKKDPTICNVDSMLFFPSASAENYVTFSKTLPDLHELSVCLWLLVKGPHVGTVLSYATDDSDNQLVLYGRNDATAYSHSSRSSSSSPTSYTASLTPSLDFVVGDPVFRRLPMASLLDARWHHLCIIWSSIQGRFWHYSDQRLMTSGSNFRKGWEIAGGGSVVLGQEQDDVGGGFDPVEGFVGQMVGFSVWNRVLSASEVQGVAVGRGLPRGMVLGMQDIKEVHGDVQQVACECLEHCV